jgi:hypothetical protein
MHVTRVNGVTVWVFISSRSRRQLSAAGSAFPFWLKAMGGTVGSSLGQLKSAQLGANLAHSGQERRVPGPGQVRWSRKEI